MTETEQNINRLTKDVAVILTIQEGCQKAQAQTTSNIDKLATSVETLSHDTVYLQTLEARIAVLEDEVKWTHRTIASTVLGAIVSAVGVVVWLVFKP